MDKPASPKSRLHETRMRALKLTKALLKLPPERARKVIKDEQERRAKIHQQEAHGVLTAPTRAEVIAQQAQLEAEQKRKDEGGDKALPAKPVTADQVDLFNTQGGFFANESNHEYSANAPAKASPMTSNSNSSSIVKLTQAKQDLAWNGRVLTPSGQWGTYSPPKPYLLKPCQVITLPVKGSASSDKK